MSEDGKGDPTDDPNDDSWTLDEAFRLNPHFNKSFCVKFNFSFCLNLSSLNYTTYDNVTELVDQSFDIFVGIVSIILGFMILITVIGNVFVIAAILLERNLQNVANYLIVSLAVADLMVACLVMPLGAVYEIMKGWVLGPALCDMWTSCDVLCCTASILHLVAIAVDRYWAVTDLDYIHSRNVNKIGSMILVVWTVALVVSLAPQFGWKDPDFLERINSQKRCLVSQDVAYQVFATCSTFYIPLFVILILYWKIFQTARKRIRRNQKLKSDAFSSKSTANKNLISAKHFMPRKKFRHFKKSSKQNSATKALVSSLLLVEGQSTATVDAVLPDDTTESQTSLDVDPKIGIKKSVQASSWGSQDAELTSYKGYPSLASRQTNIPDGKANFHLSDDGSLGGSSGEMANDGFQPTHTSELSRSDVLCPNIIVDASCNSGVSDAILKTVNPPQILRGKRESLEAKRERKAAKTLAIITGAFVVCWLPFFVMALLMPLFGPISDQLASFFLWLGYFNSTLNPVIYTVFSPEFRNAFKRILCGASKRGYYYRAGHWR